MSITSQDNISRTRPHRRVEKILDDLRISYESEYEFPGRYALDSRAAGCKIVPSMVGTGAVGQGCRAAFVMYTTHVSEQKSEAGAP